MARLHVQEAGLWNARNPNKFSGRNVNIHHICDRTSAWAPDVSGFTTFQSLARSFSGKQQQSTQKLRVAAVVTRRLGFSRLPPCGLYLRQEADFGGSSSAGRGPFSRCLPSVAAITQQTWRWGCPAPSRCWCCWRGCGWSSWSAAWSCEHCCPSPPS